MVLMVLEVPWINRRNFKKSSYMPKIWQKMKMLYVFLHTTWRIAFFILPQFRFSTDARYPKIQFRVPNLSLELVLTRPERVVCDWETLLLRNFRKTKQWNSIKILLRKTSAPTLATRSDSAALSLFECGQKSLSSSHKVFGQSLPLGRMVTTCIQFLCGYSSENGLKNDTNGTILKRIKPTQTLACQKWLLAIP